MSDDNKRRNYDKYGFEGMGGYGKSHGNFSFAHADDIFKHFFGDFGFENEDDQTFFGSRFGSIFNRGAKRKGFENIGHFSDPFFSGFGTGFGIDMTRMGGSSGFGNSAFGSSFGSSFESGDFGGMNITKKISTVTKTM